MMKKTLLFIFLVLVGVFATITFDHAHGFRKKRPAHHEYANVVIDNYSSKNDIAPVVFNHWLHRAQYTCRLCHVDLNFAMEGGGTNITEDSNQKGLYCGACHNGDEAFAPTQKITSGEKQNTNCDRCHSDGKQVKFEKNFYEFTKNFPRARFGNGIDWLKAEKEGLVQLKDYLEGVSFKRKRLKDPVDTLLETKETEMPGILFSHKKHAVWNGCELCHPEMFKIKKGETKFSMLEIFEGKFCGICHGKVSFPSLDCQRCHTEEVQ
jgi:c(7)-type cytochrome triheme protein